MIDHDEALRQIITRAQEDAGFRDQLKAEPRAALAALLGIEIPSAMTVSVLEDTPTHLHIVLPADDALSDEALETVAGGNFASWVSGDSPSQHTSSGIKSRGFGRGD